ncbi:acyl-CoA dehydrogenase [Sphingomonas sp. 37zxx]|uniref:acyl-CoA dehydrogenase n=1 Tax=Sphingomonas sp. 37zxx TaxID=1550073 RepID=UPI00053BE1A6|nr:acyl-CoA dehydrogenase [Sphingomonas sp. 37zxx]
MDFSISDDQQQILDSIGSMLAQEAAYDRLFPHDFDEAADEARLIAFSAEMGLIGFGVPATAGGSGAALDDTLLVQREAGRYILPLSVPLAAAAALVAMDAGNEALAHALVAGTEQVAIGFGDDADGTRSLMGRGDIVLAPAQGRLQLLRLSGPAPEHPGLDPATPVRRTSALTLEADTLSAATLAQFELLLSAYRLGLAEAALQQSLAFAREREQFGKPIGSFQVVRHRCVDMAVRCEAARSVLFFAAICLRDGRPGWELQTASARWLTDKAAVENAKVNIVNHGAIGVTCENIGHRLLKRAMLCSTIGPSHAETAACIVAAGSSLLC